MLQQVLSRVLIAVAVGGALLSQVGCFGPTTGGSLSSCFDQGCSSPPSDNPAPVISSISPMSAVAGGNGTSSFSLTISGSGFTKSSVVSWNGNSRTTNFGGNSAQLTATILASDIASSGTATIKVTNPTPGGGTSNGVSFTISPAAPAAGIIGGISVNRDGISADAINVDVALSANGRYAALQSNNAHNLLLFEPPLQTFIGDQIYFHDSCLNVPSCTLKTQLASVRNSGSPDDGTSIGDGQGFGSISMSGDGRFTAFRSDSTNLSSQTAQFTQAYVNDNCTGASGCFASTKMVSLTDAGTEPNDIVLDVRLSAQGRYVAFISQGTNVVPGVTQAGEAYIRDTCQGADGPVTGCTPTTILISADDNGNPADTSLIQILGITISANGRFVVFASNATNLPGAPDTAKLETYLRDTCLGATGCTPSTKLISLDSQGNPAPNPIGLDINGTSISDSGRVIAFGSLDVLAPGGVLNKMNLYLRDTCQTETGPVNGCVPSTITASLANDGSPSNGNVLYGIASTQFLSGTGRFVIFLSDATNLITNGTPEHGVFVRDTCIGAATGCSPSTVLVSKDGTHNFVDAVGNPAISSDGHYCAFIVGPQILNNLDNQIVLAGTSF